MTVDSFVDAIIRWRYALAALAAIAASLALIWGKSPDYDRSIESMFASDDEVLADYRQLKRTFGGNEVVLAVYQDPGLFDVSGAGIERSRQIRQRLEKVPGVRAVLSIDLPLPRHAVVTNSFVARRTRRLFQGYTHGVDGITVGMVCMLDDRPTANVSRRITVNGLRAIVQDLPDGLAPGQLTGEPVIVEDGFRFVEQDGKKLGRWSALILSVTIILCFRSFRWVVILVLIVQLSILLTNAVSAAAGFRLSLVSSMLTAVVMVISVATVVHVIVRYSESRTEGLDKLAALKHTLRLVAMPVVWSCVTDAIGFISLTASQVEPVRDFGVMMAIGSLMVLISVFSIVPAGVLVGRIDQDPKQPWGQRSIDRQLLGSVDLIRRSSRIILWGIVLFAIVAVAGMFQTEVETDFTKNFRSDSEIVRAYQVVETRLGGASSCDLILPAPDKLDWKFLSRVTDLSHAIDQELRSRYAERSEAVNQALSLATAVETLAEIDSKPALLREGICQSTLFAMRGMMPDFFSALYGIDPRDGKHYLRIMLRVPEQQTALEKQSLIRRLDQLANQYFPGSKITGYFVLLSTLIDSVVQDQWLTLGISVVGIGLLMLCVFRNFRLAAIALVPNLLPVIGMIGLLGWLRVLIWPDLKVNIGVAMIAAVSMGLSIDSSIHYIMSFQRARQTNGFDESMAIVQCGVGRAMVLSTLALIIGFTVLATSEFVPTIYFGVLVSLTMLGGLLGNLVILPVLLQFDGSRKKGK